MKIILLIIASGILLALCLPPYNLAWLGWFSVTPVMVAAHHRRPLEAAGIGMLACALCGFLHVGWTSNPALLLAGYVPFLWLAMLVGIVVVTGSLSRQRWQLGGLRWVLLAACVGVAAEWLTTLSPLPLYLAVLEYKTLPLIQISGVTGIWGVSFLLWWTNAAIADAVLQSNFSPRALSFALVLPLLAFGYGVFSLSQINNANRKSLRVAAIQDYGAGASREELTRRAVVKGAQLVVWSEECLGASFTPESKNDPTIKLARSLNTHLVVGYSEEVQPKPYNCTALIAPDGSIKGVHRKIHLFSDERQIVQPGHAATAFPSSLGKVGLEICYDNCFTDVSRRVTLAGAQVIAVPNYDPPTPRAVLHRLHSTLLPFRAVENRVPFIRSDSNGMSQIVNLDGSIIGELPMSVNEALVGNVSLGDGKGTLFTRFGDWFAYGCWACIVGILLSVSLEQKKRSDLGKA